MLVLKNFSVGDKIKEVGFHTIIYGLGSFAQSASSLILLPILTSTLSVADFGAYSLILMVSGIANAIFYFGMTSALQRSYFDFETEEDRKSVTTTAFTLLLLGALLQTTIGYIYRTSLAQYLLGNEIYGEAVFYGMLSGAMVFINTFLFGYLRLVKKSIASVILSLILLIITVGLTIYFQKNISDNVAAPFMALATANFSIAMLFLTIYGSKAFNLKIKRAEISNLVSFGFSIILASFGGLLIDSLDRLLIQKFMGLTEVGQFSAALRVGMLINILLVMPFNQIWAPIMLEYRNKEKISELFTKVFTIYMLLGIIIVSLATLFSWEILSILIKTEINNEMIYVFIGTLCGLLIVSSINFLSAGLFFERKVQLLPIAYYAVAGIKIGVGLILVPLLGLTGAILSGLFSSILLPITIWKLSKKYFYFNMEWRRLVKIILLISPTFIWGIYLSEQKDGDIIPRVIWYVIQLILIYRFGLLESERRIIFKTNKSAN